MHKSDQKHTTMLKKLGKGYFCPKNGVIGCPVTMPWKRVKSHSDWKLSQISFRSSRLPCSDMPTQPASQYSAGSFLLFLAHLSLPAVTLVWHVNSCLAERPVTCNTSPAAVPRPPIVVILHSYRRHKWHPLLHLYFTLVAHPSCVFHPALRLPLALWALFG